MSGPLSSSELRLLGSSERPCHRYNCCIQRNNRSENTAIDCRYLPELQPGRQHILLHLLRYNAAPHYNSDAADNYPNARTGTVGDQSFTIRSFDMLLAQSQRLSPPETASLVTSEVDSTALQETAKDVDDAFQNFFTGTAKYPRFKRKQEEQSYTSNAVNGNICFHDGFSSLQLPKLGKVKCKGSDDLLRRLFKKGKEAIHDAVGIDLGAVTFAVLSDGTTISNPRYYTKAQSKTKQYSEKKKIVFLRKQPIISIFPDRKKPENG